MPPGWGRFCHLFRTWLGDEGGCGYGAIDTFGKIELVKKVFWALFMVLARVLDPVTAQQVIGVIAGVDKHPPVHNQSGHTPPDIFKGWVVRYDVASLQQSKPGSGRRTGYICRECSRQISSMYNALPAKSG